MSACAYLHVCAYECVFLCMFVRARVCVCSYVCACVCVHAFVRAPVRLSACALHVGNSLTQNPPNKTKHELTLPPPPPHPPELVKSPRPLNAPTPCNSQYPTTATHGSTIPTHPSQHGLPYGPWPRRYSWSRRPRAMLTQSINTLPRRSQNRT